MSEWVNEWREWRNKDKKVASRKGGGGKCEAKKKKREKEGRRA